MTIWIPYKAKPHEKNRIRNTQTKQYHCRICGRTIARGSICPTCLIKKKES